ncbi:hypothetical protein HMPREF9347_02815 [Escherichia coli MS 124-1]|nr:hypothetical protein HMPREF9347_02815 [Escherichia coli MS 124-1]
MFAACSLFISSASRDPISCEVLAICCSRLPLLLPGGGVKFFH